MKKRTKIIIAIVSVILIVFVSANYILKGVLSEVISDLNANEEFPIHIEYKNTRFDIYRSHFKIMDAEISIKNPKVKPQLNIHVESINFSGLGLFKIFNHKYVIKDLIIVNPTVSLYHLQEYDKVEEKPSQERGDFPYFSWSEIKIVRGNFKNFNIVENDTILTTEINGVNLNFIENDITSIADLLNKGKFNIDALSLNVGERSKLYLRNSEVNLLRKRVVLRNVVFVNDEEHKRFFKSLKYGSLWKNVKLDSLEILGFNFNDTVNNDQLAIDSVIVFSPNVLVKSKQGLLKNPESKNFDLGNIIPSAIKLDHILVKNGKLEFRKYNKSNNKYKVVSIDTVNVHINRSNYSYPDSNYLSKSHPIGVGEVALKNIKLELKHPHELLVSTVTLSLTDDKLHLENIFINNTLNAEKFVANQPFKEDWTELRVGSVDLDEFNIQKYLDTDSLLVGQVKIQKAVLDSRNAGDLKRRPNRVGLLMHHWFRSIPGHHDIKNIKLLNSRVIFRMYFEHATKSGLLDIQNITASVDRITNLDKSVETHVNGKGSYLGKNNLSMYVKLKVYDKDYKYHVNTTAKNINLPDINSLIRPLNISFHKGYMHLLQMQFDSKNLSSDAVGEVLFHYENLEVEIIKKDKKIEKQKLKNSTSEKSKNVNESNLFLSFAVNMVAKTENMPGKEGYVVGRFEISRKSYQGFFGQVIGCMAKGAQVSLLNKKDKVKVKEERKNKKEEKRKNREERKKSRESLKEMVD